MSDFLEIIWREKSGSELLPWFCPHEIEILIHFSLELIYQWS